MTIDTHCHLDNYLYRENYKEIIKRAYENGIKKFIIPGADPKTLKKAVELSEEFKYIYFSVGLHPYHIDNLELFNSQLEYSNHKKCIAIGECGLDYFRLPKDISEQNEIKDKQKYIFIKQIEMANNKKLPLIIHIREASKDSLDILNKYSKSGGVLHCYNSDEILLSLVDKNFYYGIGGVITFKNAQKLRDSYLKIPKDRVILETDSPYLTPHPHRGKINEPSYIDLVLDKISELESVSKTEIIKRSRENTFNLFKI